ncbi:MAG: hypothetical protein ACOYJK_10375 [Prevotella sp.]
MAAIRKEEGNRCQKFKQQTWKEKQFSHASVEGEAHNRMALHTFKEHMEDANRKIVLKDYPTFDFIFAFPVFFRTFGA